MHSQACADLCQCLPEYNTCMAVVSAVTALSPDWVPQLWTRGKRVCKQCIRHQAASSGRLQALGSDPVNICQHCSCIAAAAGPQVPSCRRRQLLFSGRARQVRKHSINLLM